MRHVFKLNPEKQQQLEYQQKAAEMSADLCLKNGIPFEKAVEALVSCPLPESNKGQKCDTLEKNKKPLSDEERKQVMDADAIWHHGPGGAPSPAVWKAVVDGKEWFVTNTHRAFQSRPTLKGAISIYHSFIKSTS